MDNTIAEDNFVTQQNRKTTQHDQDGCAIKVLSGCTIKVESGCTITVDSGGTLTVESEGTITVQSGGTITVQSGGTIRVQPEGTTTAKHGGATTVQPRGSTTVQQGATTPVRPESSTTVQPGGTTTVQPGGTTKRQSECSATNHEDEFLNSWFSELDKKSYIIPVTHLDHILADSEDIGDVPIAKLRPKAAFANPEIKERDETHKKIHAVFTRIKDRTATGEVMVMMTQASFSMYSSLVTAVSAPVSVSRTKDVPFDQIKHHKLKHSDMVIVNKQSGVLVGVAQSVHFADLSLAKQKLEESVKYLTDAANKIKELLKTVSEVDNVAVHTTLVLTNITRAQLEKLQEERYI